MGAERKRDFSNIQIPAWYVVVCVHGRAVRFSQNYAKKAGIGALFPALDASFYVFYDDSLFLIRFSKEKIEAKINFYEVFSHIEASFPPETGFDADLFPASGLPVPEF